MITIDTMPDGYVDIIHHIIDNGRSVSPRGQRTLEVPDVVIKLKNPARALALGVGRKLNLSIAAAEAVQLIGGFLDPHLLLSVSKTFAQFMDDGTFWGGYGERIQNQVLVAGQKLIMDNDTRQAVVTIWDKDKDNVPGKHDYPCTLSLTFQVRDHCLELHTTMRSNDVWLGLPYDIFQFTQLQITMARALGFGLGAYYHHAVSLHLYTRDMGKAAEIHKPIGSILNHPLPLGFGRARDVGNQNLFGMLKRAHMIGTGDIEELHPSRSEAWYIEKLKDHVGK